MTGDLVRKNVWFEPELWAEVKDVADDRGQSPSLVIGEAVETYLDKEQQGRTW
jgi:hypothetical protein